VFGTTAGGCSGLLIRASLFSGIGGFDERLPAMQDWDLWIRLIERQALYYSGIEGVVYDSDSTQKITHNLKAKYLGLRRLYFKHFDVWTSVSASGASGSGVGIKAVVGTIRPALI
jgi:hypothetical protein